MAKTGDSKKRDTVTAALIIIGDEILSGRTKDENIGYVADYLTEIGIQLREVRIIGDDETHIVETVNAMRASHTYVFTTGGIGPLMTTSLPTRSPRRSGSESISMSGRWRKCANATRPTN